MTSSYHVFAGYLALIGATWVQAATDPARNPVGIEPWPAVIAHATAHAIPLADFDLENTLTEARVGDSITVLFTLEEAKLSRQWLVEIRRASLTEREANSQPGSGLGVFSIFLSSLKTDTGYEYGFETTPAALELRTFGPFENTSTSLPQEIAPIQARALASREYLAHGLAGMCEIETRLHQSGKQDPGLSFKFHPRYSAQQGADAKARAEAAGFTQDDERVFAAGYFALVQFAQLAFRTAGVSSIIREILDSPTLFSGAFIHPDWSGLKSETGTAWSLPEVRIFRVPYSFQSKTKARGVLFVTEPRPPLQNIAGIVGLTIDGSSKAPDKRLIMRVLAGRRGPLDRSLPLSHP